MHSKAHFKSIFKSPEISTVEPKNVFFLNTTLPKQHNHIYFKIFRNSQIKDTKITKHMKLGFKSEKNELAF